MRLRHAVPFTLIAGIAAVACAGAAMAPELSVMKAGSELGDTRRASYTLSLASDEQELADFNQALIEADSDDAETPEGFEDLLAFLDSSLNLSWDKGDDIDSPADDAIALRVDIDDMDDAVEARFVNGTFYARADARRLAGYFGAPAGAVDEFLAQTKGFGLDFLAGAVDGRWLAHDLDPIVSFFKGMAGNGAFEESFRESAGFGFSDLRPEAIAEVVDSFSEIYGNDVDVAKGEADGPGTHYTLTASARDLYRGMAPVLDEMPFLEEAFSDLAPGKLPPAEAIPDEDYSADVWISDGKITRIEFDFAQLSPAGTFPAGIEMPRMALRLDIERNPSDVTVPDDITKVDVFELIGRLASGAGLES